MITDSIQHIHPECSAKFCNDECCPYVHHECWYYNGEYYNTREEAVKARRMDDPEFMFEEDLDGYGDD